MKPPSIEVIADRTATAEVDFEFWSWVNEHRSEGRAVDVGGLYWIDGRWQGGPLTDVQVQAVVDEHAVAWLARHNPSYQWSAYPRYMQLFFWNHGWKRFRSSTRARAQRPRRPSLLERILGFLRQSTRATPVQAARPA